MSPSTNGARLEPAWKVQLADIGEQLYRKRPSTSGGQEHCRAGRLPERRSDAALVECGCGQCFAESVRRVFPSIRHEARRWEGWTPSAGAEDLTQEALGDWSQEWRRWDPSRGTSLPGFARMVAKSRYFRMRRDALKEKRRADVEATTLDTGTELLAAAADYDPVRVAEAREALADFCQAIRSLTPRYRLEAVARMNGQTGTGIPLAEIRRALARRGVDLPAPPSKRTFPAAA